MLTTYYMIRHHITLNARACFFTFKDAQDFVARHPTLTIFISYSRKAP